MIADWEACEFSRTETDEEERARRCTVTLLAIARIERRRAGIVDAPAPTPVPRLAPAAAQDIRASMIARGLLKPGVAHEPLTRAVADEQPAAQLPRARAAMEAHNSLRAAGLKVPGDPKAARAEAKFAKRAYTTAAARRDRERQSK